MNQNPEISQPETKATKLPFIILALLGVGLIGYCIFGAITLLAPKQTKTTTETEIATKDSEHATEFNAQTPSDRAQALLDESAQWAMVFEESFDSNTNVNGWNMGEGSTADIESNLEVRDGKYLWDVTTKNTVLGALSPMTLSTVRDFHLTADVKLTSGTYKPVHFRGCYAG